MGKGKFIKKIIEYFLQGLLYTAPIGLTIYVVFIAFDKVDAIVRDLLRDISGVYIPGVGIITMFVLITILGYSGNTIIGEPIKLMFQRFMANTPVIKIIYTSLRDFFSAFVSTEKKFTKPVLVIMDKNTGIERIGFITQEDLSRFDIAEKVAVVIPFSYAFTAELLIVPKELIKPLNISSSEAMKFVVSGGVSRLEKNKKQEE